MPRTDYRIYNLHDNSFYSLSHLYIGVRVTSLPLLHSPSNVGKLATDGTMHIKLCDFIEPWEDMSATQKKSLIQRYEMGCECKVEL